MCYESSKSDLIFMLITLLLYSTSGYGGPSYNVNQVDIIPNVFVLKFELAIFAMQFYEKL